MTQIVRMQQRRDTSARWALINPVLRAGEFGFDMDLERVKVGDGVTAWADLLFVDDYVGGAEAAAAAAEAAQAAAEAAAAEASEISGLTGEDAAVKTLINNPTSQTRGALSATSTQLINTLVPVATTSAQGKVELATTGETLAGTDTSRAVTPASVRAKVNTAPRLNTAVLFGTSLEFQNDTGADALDPSNANVVSGRGWWNWFNAFAGQQFTLLHNSGVGGNLSSQMLARVQADVLDYDPDWVFMGAPTNDPTGDIAPATTIANMDAILDAFADRRVALYTHPPRDVNNTASRRLAVSLINEYIRNLPLTRKNVIVVDAWKQVGDPSTGNPAMGMSVDGTHWTEAAAMRVGAKFAEKLAPFIIPTPTRSLSAFDPRSVCGNASFVGSGSGWADLGIAGVTTTWAKTGLPFVRKMVLDITGVTTATEHGNRYVENISAGRFAPGDVIQATARFTWTGLTTLPIPSQCHPLLRIMLRRTDNTWVRQDVDAFFLPTASPAWAVPAGVPATGTLVAKTFKVTIPSTGSPVDRIYYDIGWQGAAAAHIEVEDFAPFKVGTPSAHTNDATGQAASPEAPPIAVSALYVPQSYDAAGGTWVDYTDNSKDLRKIGTGPFPTKVTASGATFVRWDSAAGTTCLGEALLSVPQPFTVIAVARMQTLPASGRHLLIGVDRDNSPSMWAPYVLPAGGAGMRDTSTDLAAAGTPFSTTAWRSIATVFNGASSRINVDGTSGSAANVGSDPVAGVALMGNAGGFNTNTLASCDLAGFAIVPSALSDADIATLVTYLKTAAGVP